MPTNRTRRTRSRRAAKLTGAELTWLTGKPQPAVNRFELISLELPTRPADFDRIDELLARADGVVPADRLAALQAENDASRKEYRARYPDA